VKPSHAYFCAVSLTTSFVIGCGTILATIPPASGASESSDTRTDTARKVRALARSSSTLGETMASAQGEAGPQGSILVRGSVDPRIQRLTESLPAPAGGGSPSAAGSYRIMARNARRLCGITSREDVRRFYRLIERESGWRHYEPDGKVLRSSSGALGLGQVKPSTALAFAPSDIREPFGNLLVSACLFQSYYQKRGNWRDAVLDYRLGPYRKVTTMAARAYSNTILGGAQ